MSLADFQRAFARIVTDPRGWSARLAGAVDLEGLELTPREIQRLRRLVGQDGMRANQVLLRSTRAMPLHSALPLTCEWLRHELPDAMEAWLADCGDASIQYGREADRFAAWLPGFLTRRGHATHAALDALNFERALVQLVRAVEAGAADPAVPIAFSHAPDDIIAGWRPDVRAQATCTRAWLRVRGGDVVLEREDVA
jgi:hypothetical protein